MVAQDNTRHPVRSAIVVIVFLLFVVGTIIATFLSIRNLLHAILSKPGSLSAQVAIPLVVALVPLVVGLCALIGVLITAKASVRAVVESKRHEQQIIIEQELRKQKVPVYEDFMGFWVRFVLSSQLKASKPSPSSARAKIRHTSQSTNSAPADAASLLAKEEKERAEATRNYDLEQFIVTFTQKITIWGSDEVVKAYASFRRRSATLQELSMSQDQVLSTVQMLLTFEEILFSIRLDVGHKNKGLEQGDLLSLFITDIDILLRMIKQPVTNE